VELLFGCHHKSCRVCIKPKILHMWQGALLRVLGHAFVELLFCCHHKRGVSCLPQCVRVPCKMVCVIADWILVRTARSETSFNHCKMLVGMTLD
jgi:hypothetical protein